MEKAQEILFHIDELYTDKASEDKIIKASINNPERYSMWVKAFERYALEDVLQAIDNYWEFKNSKVKPNVAQIKAILNNHAKEEFTSTETGDVNVMRGDIAYERMQSDIENGNCRHNLYIYRDAVDIILNEWLREQVPSNVFARMKYADKVRQAEINGLFVEFDNALCLANQRRFGDNYEFQSSNDMINADAMYSSKNYVEELSEKWSA